MTNDPAIDTSHEGYIVEVDGIAKAEYPIFVNALKATAYSSNKSFRTAVSSCATSATRRRTNLHRCRQSFDCCLARKRQIARIKALDLIDGCACVLGKIEDIDRP
jgi:hypothetical protein